MRGNLPDCNLYHPCMRNVGDVIKFHEDGGDLDCGSIPADSEQAK